MQPAIHTGIYILCVCILDRPGDMDPQQPRIHQATRVSNSYQQVKDHQINLNQFSEDATKNLTRHLQRCSFLCKKKLVATRMLL